MSTTIYRVGKNITPNFYVDNTGVNIDRQSIGITATSGTVSVVPTKEYCLINFENGISGNVYININATHSLIGDRITVMAGTTGSFSVVADTTSNVNFTTVAINNKSCVIGLYYNGTNFLGNATAL